MTNGCAPSASTILGATMTPKMRVSWNEDRRRWQVWEDHGIGHGIKHHSWHRTESDARSTARAQARQDKKDAARAS